MSDALRNPTDRFTDRVEDYVRHRPGYPDDVLHLLAREAGLTPAAVVADVGAGTGISSELFLRFGCTVFAVEPNSAMRQAAEAWLAGRPHYHSITGTAEATGLPDRSVDYVVAGQAAHWFDLPAAAREFARILRDPGWVVLLWNTRKTDATPFLRAYEALLVQYGTDYRQVVHTNFDRAALRPLFADGNEYRALPNAQEFDLPGLKGRLLSSSYVPPPGHPSHAPLMAAAERLFDEHQENGRVRMDYDCEVYFGRVR